MATVALSPKKTETPLLWQGSRKKEMQDNREWKVSKTRKEEKEEKLNKGPTVGNVVGASPLEIRKGFFV